MTGSFTVIAISAVVVSLAVHWVEGQGVSHFVVSALTLLEHAILAFDVPGSLGYIATKTYRHLKGSDDDED